jgi:hypothetical protein
MEINDQSIGSKVLYGLIGSFIGAITGFIFSFIAPSGVQPFPYFLPLVFGGVLGLLCFFVGKRFLQVLVDVITNLHNF